MLWTVTAASAPFGVNQYVTLVLTAATAANTKPVFIKFMKSFLLFEDSAVSHLIS
jgi:hypothetical protein